MQFDGQYYQRLLIGFPEILRKFWVPGLSFVRQDNFSQEFVRKLPESNFVSDNQVSERWILFRYLTYRNGDLEMTAGNFYEQFW